jgi:hypothetical protein
MIETEKIIFPSSFFLKVSIKEEDLRNINPKIMKAFSFSFEEFKELNLKFDKFTFEDINGKISTFYLDEDGNELKRANQTEDLRNIIPSGGYRRLYIDEENNIITWAGYLVKVNLEGKPIKKFEVESLLKLEKKTIDLDDLLDYDWQRTYLTRNIALYNFLKELMEEKGKLVKFRYDDQNRQAILMPHKEIGIIIAMVGNKGDIDPVEEKEIEHIDKIEEIEEVEEEEVW